MPDVNEGASVELQKISKSFGRFQAVDQVSLSIGSRRFLTLLGPSGSGKTTTLMLIAGFEAPDAGEILIGNRPVTHLPPYERGLGFVFQHYALFPHMTVAENLAFPLKLRGIPAQAIERRVGETLELVMLPGYENRMPRQLSGGQQQRVALGRALIFKPSVLLMDEPLSALDKRLRQQMQLEIKRIQRNLDVTVVYVTHDQEEALTMSDSIVVMNEGRVAQVGAPEEIYERPSNVFVADFVGETNFLTGRVRQRPDHDFMLETKGGECWPLGRAEGIAEGQMIKAAIRPEKISLLSNGAETAEQCPEGDRLINGSVEDIVYLGDLCKYAVRVRESLIVVKHLAAREARRFEVGQDVFVRWDHADLRLMPL